MVDGKEPGWVTPIACGLDFRRRLLARGEFANPPKACLRNGTPEVDGHETAPVGDFAVRQVTGPRVHGFRTPDHWYEP